jgi:hypothetical protein
LTTAKIDVAIAEYGLLIDECLREIEVENAVRRHPGSRPVSDAPNEGRGVGVTARLLRVSAAKVVEVRWAMSPAAGPDAMV